MPNNPLVQVSTPIRSGEFPQVVVRTDSVGDVMDAKDVLDALRQELLGLMQDVVTELRDAGMDTAKAIANLQAAGMNPQPVPPQGYAPATSSPAPTVPIAASPASQCPACSRNTACTECGGATQHGIKESKAGAKYNAHMCVANSRHKVVWCKTPIPPSFQGVLNNPSLVYG